MVKRDGEFQRIMTEDLVPGDITFIEGGSGNFGFLAGDIRIVKIQQPVFVESYFLYKDCLNYLKEMTEEQTSEDEDKESGGLLSSIAKGITGMFQSKEEDDLSGPLEFSFHVDTIAHICEMFSSDVEKGLTTEQAAINREKSGKNKYNSYEKIMNYTKCKRDGEYKHIMSRRLTIGDIVTLKAPQVVPADIRVVEATADCLVNKSALNGESEPQKVSTEKTHDNPLETQNIVFATTKLVQGACTGIVTNVGKNTVIGRIGGLSTTLG